MSATDFQAEVPARPLGTAAPAMQRSEPTGPTPEYPRAVRRETDTAFAVSRRNAHLDLAVRCALFLVALAALAIAVVYTYNRGDAMVGELLADRATGLNEERIVALTLPVSLLVLLTIVALVAAWFVQTRGGADFERTMEGVSRLRREAEGGVSRTRTSTHALEEFYDNARRAFRLQLWLGRTLFVVFLTLFFTAVFDGVFNDVDQATLALGAGSLLSLIFASLSGTGSKVGAYLADATQMQLNVGGASRQVNVLEDHMYEVLERAKRDPVAAGATIDHGTAAISQVVETSVQLIQKYAEPFNERSEQGEPPPDI